MTLNNKEMDKCQCTILHGDVIDRVKMTMPHETHLFELADMFKVFGETSRVKILCALFSEELCVCDLAALLSMSQSSVSHQLRVLKQARLVKYRKDGKVVYYSLSDDHVKHIFNQGLSHVVEQLGVEEIMSTDEVEAEHGTVNA